MVEGQDKEPHSPVLVRAPREPTQRGREAHEATHLPHAERCEFCMRGRARNKAHRRDGTGKRDYTLPETLSDDERPVPKISLDYFFFGNRHPKMEKPVVKMTTKQLKDELRIAELPKMEVELS